MEKVTIGQCVLYHADCLDILPDIEKVGALVIDPPYGQNYRPPDSNLKANKKVKKSVRTFGRNDTILNDDKPFDPTPFLEFPEQIIWGANNFSSKLPDKKSWLVWDKRCGNYSNDFADCEMAWSNLNMPPRMIRHLWNGAFKASEHGHQRYHPTQKPIEVMKWCIGFTKSDLILDLFMGSGTTGVAAVKMGRKFIGVELDKQYFDIAVKRISDAYAQPDMFLEANK